MHLSILNGQWKKSQLIVPLYKQGLEVIEVITYLPLTQCDVLIHRQLVHGIAEFIDEMSCSISPMICVSIIVIHQ